ncbi:zinc-binding dehydrogenase [Exiguobacterium flavidum]|uniref:zinc-binding dehydrogenase n=1 Tax=Exiguobacterium flavidum TaxID=2184695 RepID=UPI000DF79ADB|nr:zinc-binding dehydrogenase [Exiguobacterium flavidum]
MKAFAVDTYGEQARFMEQEIEPGPLAPDEIRIKVEASSINPLDTKMFTGKVAVAPENGVLQGDVTGTVVAIGTDVTAFEVGDAIIAYGGGLGKRGGALAEQMDVPAVLAIKKPDALAWEVAGALPIIGLTAMEALKERAKVEPGMRVYVAGGTGGVGHLVVQLAKHFGCDVTASASSEEKAAWLQKRGVRIHLYKQETAEALLERLGHDGFDVIIDTVGGDHLQESFKLARDRGRIVSIATRTTQDLTPMHSKALALEAMFVALPLLKGKQEEMKTQSDHLQSVANLAANGTIEVVIEKTVERTIDSLQAAYEAFDNESHFGKVVVR